MPRNPRSLQLTESYRRRLLAIRERLERDTRARWPRIEDFDTSPWLVSTANATAQAQREGVRTTAGYLAALLSLELGRRVQPPRLEADRYVGLSRDGRPLNEALETALIGTRARLSVGEPPEQALSYGLNRALRMTAHEAVQTPREALLDAVEADERLGGWQRAVAGTCAACMALSGESAPHFEVHPGCQCLPLPTVRGVPERVALPTGAALFARMNAKEQEKAVGPTAAEVIREGKADLKDFVAHSPQARQDDFLTQAPVQDAT